MVVDLHQAAMCRQRGPQIVAAYNRLRDEPMHVRAPQVMFFNNCMSQAKVRDCAGGSVSLHYRHGGAPWPGRAGMG